MTAFRAGFLVLFLATAAYVNSLGNGFAYDDNAIVLRNPVVTSGDWKAALSSPYQPEALTGAGLYRPITSLAFTLEWRAFGENPLGYHAVNLLLHGLVSLFVFFLLLEMVSTVPALVGGALFAVHPVHTEAVANVVGQAELLAAAGFLGACLLYWRGRDWEGWRRLPRLVGIGILYFISLGAKEIGVTLPLVFLLLDAFRDLDSTHRVALVPHLKREAATFLLLSVVFFAYMALRASVLGSLMGEVTAPVFRMLTPGQRILTAISLWVQYLRLSLFPVDLAADYAPGVLFPAEGMDQGVLLGAVVLLGLFVLVLWSFRERGSVSLAGLGILWFAAVVLPVSNLLFPTGVLLAERTLYLPSVGISLAAGGVAAVVVLKGDAVRRWALVGSLAVLFGLFVRTTLRNPAWLSSFVVLETLNEEHPESHLSLLSRGTGLDRVGETEAAREAYSMAVRLAPERYGVLTEVAEFYGRIGDWREAESLLRRAIGIAPELDEAYRLLSAQLLRRQLGREAHRVAAAGLAEAGFHPDLWGSLSESYVMRGDLAAALRARRTAVSLDSTSAFHWRRLAEILDALGEAREASTARSRALALGGEWQEEGAGP